MQVRLTVPRIIPTGNKREIMRNRSTGRPFIMPNLEAQNFRAHVRAGCQQLVGELRKNPEFTRIHFPIDTGECPLRIDCFFCFQPESGRARCMRSSDEDNLKKGLYDGMKGVVFDDDRGIVEGYFAKGVAPTMLQGKPFRDEVIFCILSRAGYRTAEWFATLFEIPVLPPWRPEDQSPILRPDAPGMGKIITDLTARRRGN